MIVIGMHSSEKGEHVARYCREHSIRKVFIFSPKKFTFTCSAANHEHIEYDNIIRYRYYYRMLQEIDDTSLVVINECMRTQDRNDLTYNCLRNFLNQTTHQIIFQYLPQIDTFDDFMILFDFDTRSRWKREKWSERLRPELRVMVAERVPEFSTIRVPVDEATRRRYEIEKRKLIDGIGLKDPHTIPRNLYLMSGRAKLSSVNTKQHYVGRNNRFKIATMRSYVDVSFPERCSVFELPHSFIRFSDFLALSRQSEVPILVADLKVDAWYQLRYLDWSQRVKDTYATLLG